MKKTSTFTLLALCSMRLHGAAADTSLSPRTTVDQSMVEARQQEKSDFYSHSKGEQISMVSLRLHKLLAILEQFKQLHEDSLELLAPLQESAQTALISSAQYLYVRLGLRNVEEDFIRLTASIRDRDGAINRAATVNAFKIITFRHYHTYASMTQVAQNLFDQLAAREARQKLLPQEYRLPLPALCASLVYNHHFCVLYETLVQALPALSAAREQLRIQEDQAASMTHCLMPTAQQYLTRCTQHQVSGADGTVNTEYLTRPRPPYLPVSDAGDVKPLTYAVAKKEPHELPYEILAQPFVDNPLANKLTQLAAILANIDNLCRAFNQGESADRLIPYALTLNKNLAIFTTNHKQFLDYAYTAQGTPVRSLITVYKGKLQNVISHIQNSR